jgi:hypothetical protein
LRTIPISSAVLTYWQQLVFLEAALLASNETKALAALVTPVLDEFPAIFQKDLDTRRGVIQASARAYIADSAIDDVIRSVFSAVLAFVKQNRKRQEFTTLFSSHIGDVVRHALRKQLDVAAEIVEKLKLKLYTDELRAPHVKALSAVIKRGKAVLEEVRKAEIARVEGRIDIREWKDEVNAIRLTVYGQLLILAAKNGRGKAWAEGFFPRTSTVRSGEEEEEVLEPGVPEEGETDKGAKPE